MQFYRKAESAAKQILQAFQTGDLPKAMAPIFINRKDNVPCRSWSWSNQLLTALSGYSDARGYRQWEKVGRNVKKGEKSFPILVPIVRKRTKKDDDGNEEEYSYIAGFASARRRISFSSSISSSMIVGSFDIILPATATGEKLVAVDHGQFPGRLVGPMAQSRQSIARMRRMRKIDF